MSKKSTNYELLRILLTLIIPVYHWLLYNGSIYAPDSINASVSLALFSSIPFACVYAFIAMSSYFFIKKETQWSLQKFLSFFALCITLFAFKYVFIHVIYTGKDMYDFIYDFFIHGAWWYVYPYLLLLLFYPLLNRFIYHANIHLLHIITGIVGILFVINSYINHTWFFNDCVMFFLIYLLMGCFHRKKTTSAFYNEHKIGILLSIISIGIIIPTLACIYLKDYATMFSVETINGIIQKIHGRYNVSGLIVGIAIFTLFKNLDVPHMPMVHKLSNLTLYVFLLHETVMSIFWRFEIKGIEGLAYLPTWQFFLLILGYLICCILFSYVIYKVYSTFIEPLWNKLIQKICTQKNN